MKSKTARDEGVNRFPPTLTERDLSLGFKRFSDARSEKLNELTARVTARLTTEFSGALDARLVQQVVSEAGSLAATTAYPSLFLPALAEEKARNASVWLQRQNAIREETLALAA